MTLLQFLLWEKNEYDFIVALTWRPTCDGEQVSMKLAKVCLQGVGQLFQQKFTFTHKSGLAL
jgi:molybdopterin/thiamine biosynthesis adenylyltransferase